MTRRRSLDDTRKLLLAAGIEILTESGVQVRLGEVNLLDVSKRAGFTTAGSAYKIWPTQARFRDDLLAEVLSRSSDVDVLGPALLRLAEAVEPTPDGFRELLRIASALEAKSMLGSADANSYMALWCLAGSDESLAASICASDRDLVAAYASLYEHLAGKCGLEFVPPFTPHLLAMTLSALLEGFIIRYRYDSSAIPTHLPRPTGPAGIEEPWHLFACGVEAIVNGFVRPVS